MTHWQLNNAEVTGQGPEVENRQAEAEEQPTDQEPARAEASTDHQAEARRWYEKAVEWMDKNRPDDEDLIRFRQEAQELLNVADTDKKPQSPMEDAPETDRPNTEEPQPSADQEKTTDDE